MIRALGDIAVVVAAGAAIVGVLAVVRVTVDELIAAIEHECEVAIARWG